MQNDAGAGVSDCPNQQAQAAAVSTCKDTYLREGYTWTSIITTILNDPDIVRGSAFCRQVALWSWVTGQPGTNIANSGLSLADMGLFVSCSYGDKQGIVVLGY